MFLLLTWDELTRFISLKISTEKPREACFDPGNIMNASRTGYDYKLGSQVSYNCHHGYTTVGGETITCVMGNDGKPVWDKALPSCKGRRDTQRIACLQKHAHSKMIHASTNVNIIPLHCSVTPAFTISSAIYLWLNLHIYCNVTKIKHL